MSLARQFFQGLLISAAALLLLQITGCSSTSSDDELGPAELIEFDAVRQFKKQWSNSVGDGQGGIYNRLRPAVDGNTVYVAASNGDVAALSADDGDELWETDLDLPLAGGVGVGGGKVLVGTATGLVIALDQQSGATLWQTNVEGEVLSAPQADSARVYVQTFDGQLLALSADNGERLWSFRTTLPVLTLRGTSSPLLYRDQVIAGFANGKLMGFNAESGTLLWDVRVAAAKGHSEIERLVDIDGTLLRDDNIVYAVSYQGNVVAVDANTGRRLWQREASSHAGLAQGFANIYVAGQSGNVTAFADNGQGVRWEQTVLERRNLSAPAVVGSYVVVADFEGYLHALSQVDGSMAARTRVDSDGVRADMVVANGMLIVFGNSGKVVAYKLEEKSSGFFSG
jgi:outer membrane protein assembly factor BamB